jgi:TonB family protein
MSKEEKLSSRPRFSRRTKLAIAIGGLLSVGVIGFYSGTASHWVAEGLHGVDNPGKDIYTLAQKTLGSYEDGTPEADVTGDMPGDSPLPEWVEQELPGAPDIDAPEASVTEHTAPPDPLSFLPTALASSGSFDTGSGSDIPQGAPESASTEPSQGNALPLDEASHEVELTALPPDVTAPSDQSASTSAPELAQTDIKSSEAFQRMVRAIGVRVGQHWRIPVEDPYSEASMVRIRITDTGDLLEAKIVQSSGNAEYDRSVLEAAQAAAPYYEVTELTGPARDMLKEFKLTFGAVDRLPPQQNTVDPSVPPGPRFVTTPEEADDDLASDKPVSSDYLAGVISRIEQAWVRPSEVSVRNDATVQVKLAVPFGSVMSADLIRTSGDDAFDESIASAVRHAGPFEGIQKLSIKEQQALQSFRLHFSQTGIYP